MTKKALCVGINDYPIAGMDLKGCVNDAKAWSALLRKQYDFPSADVRVLLDKAATHEQVIDGLKALLAGARSGDVLVFTNSSHGTYVADDGQRRGRPVRRGHVPVRLQEARCSPTTSSGRCSPTSPGACDSR